MELPDISGFFFRVNSVTAVFAYLFYTIYYGEFKDKTNFFGNVLNSNYQQLTLLAQTGVGLYKTIVLFNYIMMYNKNN